MGRHQQPQIKQRILEACTDYALEHGLPDRLAPLAGAAGTSNRMLIYSFSRRGSRRGVEGGVRIDDPKYLLLHPVSYTHLTLPTTPYV